jgi:hypothetical protein
MNFDRIVSMFMRVIGRRLINGGINKGMALAARKGKSATPAAASAKAVPQSDAERQQTQSARDTAKRARQAARITRRLGR